MEGTRERGVGIAMREPGGWVIGSWSRVPIDCEVPISHDPAPTPYGPEVVLVGARGAETAAAMTERPLL